MRLGWPGLMSAVIRQIKSQENMCHCPDFFFKSPTHYDDGNRRLIIFSIGLHSRIRNLGGESTGRRLVLKSEMVHSQLSLTLDLQAKCTNLNNKATKRFILAL